MNVIRHDPDGVSFFMCFIKMTYVSESARAAEKAALCGIFIPIFKTKGRMHYDSFLTGF